MFLKMLKVLQVSMMKYWRYVDDNGNVLTSVDPGVRIVGGGPDTSPWLEVLPFFPPSPWLEVKPELVEQDKLRSEDERTAAFLCEVANSIHPSITVKSDYPSKNPDEKMPLLDLKLWVEEDKINFCFYSKEMSSKYFIPFKSAHSKSMKRSMLANEGLRRFLNVSPHLEWNEPVKVMNEFSVKCGEVDIQPAGGKKQYRHPSRNMKSSSNKIRMTRDLYLDQKATW